MRKLFVLLLATASLACTDTPVPLPEIPAPVDSVAPASEPEAPADSEKGKPDSPGKSEDAPGREAKLAQEACTPSLMVNGAFATGQIVTMESLPRELQIEVVDCPNMRLTEARRDSVAWRLNFGGMDPAGAGEVYVSLVKRGAIARGVSRYGSERVKLSPKSPVVSEGRVKVDSQTERLIGVFTMPTRRTTPTERVDTPVRYKQVIAIRQAKSDEPYRVEISVRYRSAVGLLTGMVIREACTPEAVASPSRFDC